MLMMTKKKMFVVVKEEIMDEIQIPTYDCNFLSFIFKIFSSSHPCKYMHNYLVCIAFYFDSFLSDPYFVLYGILHEHVKGIQVILEEIKY